MRTSTYEPTPEQIAQADTKRLKRLEKRLQQEQEESRPLPPGSILARPWISLSNASHTHKSVKVMTWNFLAQCLVRSELFPTSGKARKANERAPMIYAEILSHDADILCMQEVDRLDKLLPILDSAGYSYTYAAGPEKPHGCLIAYRNNMFQSVHAEVIEYDNLQVHHNPEFNPDARIGSSHRTKNIGSIVALQWLGSDSQHKGYIVATTHLFWHPAYTYERARQASLLLREVVAFQESRKLNQWPCIIAGDFNFSPDDPAYSLLVGDALSLEQRERLEISRVVHVSIDPSVPQSIAKEADEGGGNEEADPDRVIRNSRVAKPSDGLLSDTELCDLVRHRLRSAYDEGQKARRALLEHKSDVVTYGDRKSLPMEKPGAHEPMWTSYTHYWKATLDYIFILDAPESRTDVTGYLQPHRTEDVAPGLPKTGICGSDHFSLCTQLVTSPITFQLE
ncbi:Endonuclease/exonuclease/phosphatase [Paxillus ammoniavirescens]|nr:Endonuclease/exonuclease/phosphatase [Paxillus ammoniavirescens]